MAITPATSPASTPCDPWGSAAKQVAEWRQARPGSLEYHLMSHRRKIAVIGLGYVGLPVAAAFARAGSPVVGFDIDHTRVRELKVGQDRTRDEASDLKLPSRSFSSEPSVFQDSDFFIVTVPTPIDAARRPDSAPCSRLLAWRGRPSRRAILWSTNRPSIPARSRKIACRSWSKLRTVTRCPTASSCGGPRA